ncbi:baseplate J/gp47 family protein [Streptomyces sioyaensis]|uniref:baseplate J/gp47 family protein n=1 Tax=Streptomyces sioyaensis TaxID=67364 RepID=UPI00378F6D52
MSPRDTCPGGLPTTPLPVDNPPGRPTLHTRIGTFGSFRRTMLSRIAARPELAALTTRDPDDHSIALLDQWAALSDVLTFYGERYAGEAYLGTATRDESVRRLVRLIGYRPRPGVSATATLAFTLDAGAVLTVPAGFAVQSVPGPGEEPQTYESLEDCAADWRLGALPVFGPPVPGDPLTAPGGALVDPAASSAVAGLLRPGDAVLLVAAGSPGALVRTTVTAVDAGSAGLRVRFGRVAAAAGSLAYRPRRTVQVFGHDAPSIAPPVPVADSSALGVHWVWGQPTAGLAIGAGEPLPLERRYEDIALGTRLLVVNAGEFTRVVRVERVTAGTAEIAGRPGPVAAVSVSPALPQIPDRRTVQITELSGDALPLLGYDRPAALGNELWVPGLAVSADDMVDGVRVVGPPGTDDAQAPVLSPVDFVKGRRVLLTDTAGQVVATTLGGQARREPGSAPPGTACHLVVSVAASPEETAALDAAATHLLGNAAAASHGATVSGEILGSADASTTFQRFVLDRGPLTRVPGATPEDALTVRVSGLAFAGVPRLLAAGPEDEVYALRTEADGGTTVQFGDGVTGALPRTGTDNIVADYRYGAGLAGRVKAHSLTQPLTRLPGLQEVTNPAAAQGGADGEDGTALRTRAPGAVRVLARAVSADDCAEVLIATGQVAKAQSATVWDGRGLLIAVTVADPLGSPIDGEGLRLLAKEASAAGPPYRRVVVLDHMPVPITVQATVTTGPRADADTVLQAVRTALADRLSYRRAALARPVHLSDLYLAVATVPGAGAVNITRLAFTRPPTMDDAAWQAFLAAHGAGDDPLPERLVLLGTRSDGLGTVLPAELPVLRAEDLTVTRISARPAPTTGGSQ